MPLPRSKAAPSRAATRDDRLAVVGGRKRTTWIWIFLLPTVILYGVYTLYPIIASY